MARFEPKTFKTFLKRMVSRVVARSRLTDMTPGGSVWSVLAAVARELDDISFQMVNLQRVWDFDTAVGEDLDERAKDVNPDEITRNPAAKAATAVVFGRTGIVGSVTVPAGTTVMVPGGGPKFVTSASATIPNGGTVSGSAAVVAVVAGADGNVAAGAISQLSAVAGVETVTNGAAATGGQDAETDAAFRARIKAYLRSLPRGTPQALFYAALSTALDAYGRIVTAQVVELTGVGRGRVYVYVDDGAGTVEQTSTLTATEVVTAAATGGERRLRLANYPVREGSPLTLELNAGAITEGVDYTLNYASGQITLDATAYPAGLTVGDALTATAYTWYTGLIQEAQRIIDGDPTAWAAYPGYRAAGTLVQVLPPAVYQQIVTAAVVTLAGYDRATVLGLVSSAIDRYINGLGIGGDVIFTELVHAAQSVAGVYDIAFVSPTGNVAMGDGELARVTSANIDLA